MSRWIDRIPNEIFEILFAIALTVVFVILIALTLWPLDKSALTLSLAKGYLLLWGLVWVTAQIVAVIARWFRLDTDSNPNAYVSLNLAVSAVLVAGWSAFAALTIGHFVADAPVWKVVILYLIALLSSYVAFVVVSSFYQGSLYKMVNLPLMLISLLVFSLWPVAGRVLYGWFFGLFERRRSRSIER